MFDKISKIKKKAVLLTDDDVSLRRFLEIVLKRAGCEVVSAEDGMTAMTAALEQNFDVIVADAVMPNLSGFDLCRMLRQNPAYEKIPFIILSGMEINLSDSDHCLADAYLLKDENLKDQLVETVTRLVAEKSERDA